MVEIAIARFDKRRWWNILRTLTILHGNSICNKSKMFWEYVQACYCDFWNYWDTHLCGNFKKEFGFANLGKFGKFVADMCRSTSLHCFNFKIPNYTIIVVAYFVGGQMKCLWCCFTIKTCYLWEIFFLCIMEGKFIVYVGRVMWIVELLEYGPLGSLKEKLKFVNPPWSLV